MHRHETVCQMTQWKFKVSGATGTDPGGWMGWLATHHEWPCNYSDMQIKSLLK